MREAENKMREWVLEKFHADVVITADAFGFSSRQTLPKKWVAYDSIQERPVQPMRLVHALAALRTTARHYSKDEWRIRNVETGDIFMGDVA